jgi:hypothetical protein
LSKSKFYTQKSLNFRKTLSLLRNPVDSPLALGGSACQRTTVFICKVT